MNPVYDEIEKLIRQIAVVRATAKIHLNEQDADRIDQEMHNMRGIALVARSMSEYSRIKS